jgi:hypothetical protein
VLTLLALVSLAGEARADYESEKNNKNMDVVERALDKFKKNPKIFDGKSIVPGASLTAVRSHAETCNNAVNQYLKYMARLTAKGKATARAKGIAARFRPLRPWCSALVDAGNVYMAAARASRDATAASKAALKATCEGVYRDAGKVLKPTELFEVLDTWAGTRTPQTADHVTEFRALFEKLVPVCQKAAYKDAVSGCKGQGIMLSSATNRRFDYGDICAGAADPNKTLSDVAMRLLENFIRHGSRELPTLESFRRDEGWIHDTAAVSYKTVFKVTEDTKKKAQKLIEEAFGAAGVSPPSDMSVVWQKKQDYLDALKKVVDATAGEWKISQSKCKGYACKLAQKSIKKGNKKASIKGVYARDWRIHKNALGIPLERTQSIWVLFKVSGEPYCQARSLTATETYKGAGKYQKAKGTRWGYARFQKC